MIKQMLEMFKWKYTALDHERMQIVGLLSSLRGKPGSLVYNSWGLPLFNHKREPTLSAYLLSTVEYVFHALTARVLKEPVNEP